MTFGYDEHLNQIMLPKTRAEITRWAVYYYETEPIVRDYVDALYIPLGRPPTPEEVAHVITPAFKLLTYRDIVRQKA